MISIQCFEHEVLRVGDQGFTEELWDVLTRWQNRQKQPYFSLVHRGIQFSQWVGVLQVGALTLEILPKAETARNDDFVDRRELVDRWKGRLLQMLKESRHLDIRTVDETSLSLQTHTVLDLVFERFLDHAEELIRTGLVKRYRMVPGNRSTVKGRIDHTVNTRLNATHRERIYTVASEYDRDNIWNRILHFAASLVSQYARSAAMRARATSLLITFPDWTPESVNPGCFDRLVYDRKSEAYRSLNRYAELIITRLNPNLQGGSRQVFALLFDMNKLWESWVFIRLRSHLAARPRFRVLAQRPKVFWRITDQVERLVRPDIVIDSEGQLPLILDTKWKVLETAVPSDDDLKQMFVYNALWDCPESVLVYPQVWGLDTTVGTYPYSKSSLRLAFLDLDAKDSDWDYLVTGQKQT